MYDALSPSRSDVQKAAFDARQYDIAVSLLEDELGSRDTVRREMARQLTPDLSAPHALATHRALLALAQTRKGATRLITTNFDSLFQEVLTRDKIQLDHYHAPLLPVPKNRWNGIVYLHGLLNDSPTGDSLDKLVVSSGDFGLAYLTERWAARFVGELFRNYVVCFVGYSLADPVLRYMTDALAADRLRGESPIEMFAFGSYAGTKVSQDKASREWRAKNVVPILYNEVKEHSMLHETIRAWATTYSTGARGKGKIVQDCILAGPLASTAEDDLVGRMLWAISESEGTPAKIFSEYRPTPTLEWLKHFCDDRFEHRDLPRFGVVPQKEVDEALRFSVAHRPMPYGLAPRMSIVSDGSNLRSMDQVMSYISQWLLRHLDDPELILWLASHGGHLSDNFAWALRRRLEEIAELEARNNAEEIDRFKADSPDGIPRPAMRKLWNLMLLSRIGGRNSNFEIFDWTNQFQRSGMTTALRMQFRSFLTARVTLRKAINLHREKEVETEREEDLKYLVNAEVNLSEGGLRDSMDSIRKSQQWLEALPQLFVSASEALRDALDLMTEVGRATERHDFGMWHMPSILDHWQNKHYHDWTFLVELVRDSWSAIFASNPDRARDLMNTLRQTPYPTFMRLALNAAREEGPTSSGSWVEWLLKDDAWWLWSTETQREVMRLLATSAGYLREDVAVSLQDAILAGPTRRMFKEDLEELRWLEIVERMQWLRLAKVRASRGHLIAGAQARLAALEEKFPTWQFEEFDREEFAYWTSGTGAPDFKVETQVNLAPRDREGLVIWLQNAPERGMFKEDDWREVCQTASKVAITSLLKLSVQNLWPVTRWAEALSVWSNEVLIKRSWKRLAGCVDKMPDDVFSEIVNSVSWWLHEAGKELTSHEDVFVRICERILRLEDDSTVSDTGDSLLQSMDHTVGQVTQALLNWWFSKRPKDEKGLPPRIANIFTRLCDTSVPRFRHGRTLLASNIVALYRVDTFWTHEHLLPLFEWNTSEVEARSAWLGYLWAPRLYKPLLAVLKSPFIETASRYENFGDVRANYASMLTLVALEAADFFSRTELQKAVGSLPIDGLVDSARQIQRSLEGAAEQRNEYWSLRVRPYFAKIWPKKTYTNDSLTEVLARIAIAADVAFPEALKIVMPWLAPIPLAYHVLRELNQQTIGKRFPKDTLALLVAIVDKRRIAPPQLRESLEQIACADPALKDDLKFQSLEDFVDKR